MPSSAPAKVYSCDDERRDAEALREALVRERETAWMQSRYLADCDDKALSASGYGGKTNDVAIGLAMRGSHKRAESLIRTFKRKWP